MDNEKALLYYKGLRPYLLKLFTHCVLLFVTLNSYYSFIDSNSSYEDFLNILKRDKVINDIELVNANEGCPDSYVEYEGYDFPRVEPGCRCDYNILKKPVCDILLQNITYSETLSKQKCQKQNTNSQRLLEISGINSLPRSTS